jgi:hypothetical protein
LIDDSKQNGTNVDVRHICTGTGTGTTGNTSELIVPITDSHPSTNKQAPIPTHLFLTLCFVLSLDALRLAPYRYETGGPYHITGIRVDEDLSGANNAKAGECREYHPQPQPS